MENFSLDICDINLKLKKVNKNKTNYLINLEWCYYFAFSFSLSCYVIIIIIININIQKIHSAINREEISSKVCDVNDITASSSRIDRLFRFWAMRLEILNLTSLNLIWVNSHSLFNKTFLQYNKNSNWNWKWKDET